VLACNGKSANQSRRGGDGRPLPPGDWAAPGEREAAPGDAVFFGGLATGGLPLRSLPSVDSASTISVFSASSSNSDGGIIVEDRREAVSTHVRQVTLLL
jgi:hypothetical protein